MPQMLPNTNPLGFLQATSEVSMVHNTKDLDILRGSAEVLRLFLPNLCQSGPFGSPEIAVKYLDKLLQRQALP
jgi:hypothetical protein